MPVYKYHRAGYMQPTPHTHMMGIVGKIISGAAFVIIGIAAIVVGAFMLRGNMHMWDRRRGTDNKK